MHLCTKKTLGSQYKCFIFCDLVTLVLSLTCGAGADNFGISTHCHNGQLSYFWSPGWQWPFMTGFLAETLSDLSMCCLWSVVWFYNVDGLQGEKGSFGEPGPSGPAGPAVSIIIYCLVCILLYTVTGWPLALLPLRLSPSRRVSCA
jgi:hypothetical protein